MDGLLIIAGSAEARALACRVPSARVHMPVPDRVARDWSRSVSTGPLDVATLAGWGIRAVIEAAHPCDARTAFAVAHACSDLGLPRLQLVRPGWRAGPRDCWVRLRAPEDAAGVIAPGSRVLVTVGRSALRRLHGLRAHVLARRLGGRDGTFPLRHGRFLDQTGPFTVAEEIALLRRERIDWLLVPDAGGTGGWPKLQAARQLGLPVALLDRPRRPEGPRVTTTEKAIAWSTTR